MRNNSKHFPRASVAAAVGALALAAGTPAFAERYVDFAPVLSSTPVYQRVSQPKQECWTETVTTSEVRRSPDVPVGAIGGTVVGNSLDQNNRVNATTVAPATQNVQRCRTVQGYADVIQGFDVRYQYNGREYVSRLPYDPGQQVRVRVNVAIDTGPPPPN